TFARKPAPLQVSYLGYPGTTGLAAMDYRLTDPHLDPPGMPKASVEEPLCLPRTYWCYTPPDDSPPVAARTDSSITFGCLTNFAKVSTSALMSWAKILDAIDGARLMLYTSEGSHCNRVREILGDRVEFMGRQSQVDYFKTYHRIDIALDSFPYAGA